MSEYKKNYFFKSFKIPIPFVPTPIEVVKKMIELANPKPNELLIDLGCGDGRIIRYASKEYGCKSIGIEINPLLINYANKKIIEEKINNAKIIHGNLFNYDFSKANILTLYLTPKAIEILKPKLIKMLLKGSRIICHDFPIKDLKPKIIEEVKIKYSPRIHRVYLYELI
jgi:ubiquinone/menaquinone biosynthesis C-methylase UbiE